MQNMLLTFYFYTLIIHNLYRYLQNMWHLNIIFYCIQFIAYNCGYASINITTITRIKF